MATDTDALVALLREALPCVNELEKNASDLGQSSESEYLKTLARRIVDALTAEQQKPQDDGRRIVCAANKSPDGTVTLQIRHCAPPEDQQGFIDNRGNWLTREEAYVVAKNAGQIFRRVGGDEGKLFSENIY